MNRSKMNRSNRHARGMLLVLVTGILPGLWLAGCAGNGDNVAPQTNRSLGAAETRMLLAGGDNSIARVAELNGYPDPQRLLDLDAPLQLTADQRFLLTRLNSTMKGKARAMGQRIVDAERDLDLFLAEYRRTGEKPATEAVHARLQIIAGLRSMLRAIHIDARLEAYSTLTETQRERYIELADIPPPPEPSAEDAAASSTPLY